MATQCWPARRHTPRRSRSGTRRIGNTSSPHTSFLPVRSIRSNTVYWCRNCLLQLRIFCIHFFDDREVRVGILPENKEITLLTLRDGTASCLWLSRRDSVEYPFRAISGTSLRQTHAPHKILKPRIRAQGIVNRIHLEGDAVGQVLLHRPFQQH